MKLTSAAAYWLFCWACWRAYTWLPWPMVRGDFGLWLLPHAGMYAYIDTWSDFRRARSMKGGEG